MSGTIVVLSLSFHLLTNSPLDQFQIFHRCDVFHASQQLGLSQFSKCWGIRLDLGLEGGQVSREMLVHQSTIVTEQWERGTDEGGIRMSIVKQSRDM